MSKKRDKQRFNDNRYDRNKRNFDNKKDSGKRFGSEIKVVSTKINKEEKKENKPKQENIVKNKTENFKKQVEIYNKPKDEIKQNQNKSKKNYNSNKNLLPFQMTPLNKEKCFICDKSIEDMPSAIIDQKDSKYYHFNCVISKLSRENVIEQKQRLVYLGSGAFGIIENPQNDNSSRFTIKKKIQFAFDK